MDTTRKEDDMTAENDGLMTTVEAARYLGMAPGTLENYRVWKRSPTYVRLGRAIRYRRSDLDAFVKEREVRAEEARERRYGW